VSIVCASIVCASVVCMCVCMCRCVQVMTETSGGHMMTSYHHIIFNAHSISALNGVTLQLSP